MSTAVLFAPTHTRGEEGCIGVGERVLGYLAEACAKPHEEPWPDFGRANWYQLICFFFCSAATAIGPCKPAAHV